MSHDKEPDTLLPVSSKSIEWSPPPDKRFLSRFRIFRWLVERPILPVGGGLVMAFWIAWEGIKVEIDGALKTAVFLFFVAWTFFAFAVYASNLWVKRRWLSVCGAFIVGIGLIFIWWAYLPTPPREELADENRVAPQPTLTPTGTITPTPSPSPTVAPKTLHDYSIEDFAGNGGNVGFRIGDTMKIQRPDGSASEIEVRYHIDAYTKASFLSFYIPPTRETGNICIALAKNYKLGLTLNKGIDAQAGGPGESLMDVRERDVRFTGRVFIYHEFPLFSSDVAKLTLLFKKNGADVQFRGPDYALARNVEALRAVGSPPPSPK